MGESMSKALIDIDLAVCLPPGPLCGGGIQVFR